MSVAEHILKKRSSKLLLNIIDILEYVHVFDYDFTLVSLSYSTLIISQGAKFRMDSLLLSGR